MIRQRPGKNLTVDFRNALSGTHVGKGQGQTTSYLGGLTASQYAELFPDYFRRAKPDIGISASGRLPGRQLPSAAAMPGVGQPATAAGRAARRAQQSGAPGTDSTPESSPPSKTTKPASPKQPDINIWQGGTPTVNKSGELPGPGIPGALREQRQRFFEALDKKPALKAKLLAIAANEQGTHPEGTQAVIEETINRAIVRGGGVEGGLARLEREIRWTSEGGYYEDTAGQGRAWAVVNNIKTRKILEASYERVREGGNVSNFAYGNASADTAKNKITGAGGIRANPTKEINGETFFEPNSDEPVYIKNYSEWKKELLRRAKEQSEQGGDPPSLSLFTPEALAQGDPKKPTAKAPAQANRPPIAFGDSITVGMLSKTRSIERGYAREGAGPAEIAAQIKEWEKSNPGGLKGRKVYLSTGLLNNPLDVASVKESIEFIKSSGGQVVLQGGPQGPGTRQDLVPIHHQIASLAIEHGAEVGPSYTPGEDGYHPKSYDSIVPSSQIEIEPQKQSQLRQVDRTGEMGGYGSRGMQSPYKYIGVHYTAGDSLESALNWAKQSNVGYQYLIDKDGTVHMVQNPDSGRSNHWGASNIHPNAKNHNSVGISFVGKDNKSITPAQIEAGLQLIERERLKYGIKPENVLGHGEVTTRHRNGDEGYGILVPFRAKYGLVPGGSSRPDIVSKEGTLAWEKATYTKIPSGEVKTEVEEEKTAVPIKQRGITDFAGIPKTGHPIDQLWTSLERAPTPAEVKAAMEKGVKYFDFDLSKPGAAEAVEAIKEAGGQVASYNRGVGNKSWNEGIRSKEEVLEEMMKDGNRLQHLDNQDQMSNSDFNWIVQNAHKQGLKIIPKNSVKNWINYLKTNPDYMDDIPYAIIENAHTYDPKDLKEFNALSGNKAINAVWQNEKAAKSVLDATKIPSMVSTQPERPVQDGGSHGGYDFTETSGTKKIKENTHGGVMRSPSGEPVVLVDKLTGRPLGSIGEGETVRYNGGNASVIAGHRSDPNAFTDRSGREMEARMHALHTLSGEYSDGSVAAMVPTQQAPAPQVGQSNVRTVDNPPESPSQLRAFAMNRVDDGYGSYAAQTPRVYTVV